MSVRKDTKSSKVFLSRSPEETMVYGKRFASGLRPGDVVGLEGDLGSGKTTLIKGIAAGLGFKDKDAVKSPTFVILHRYPSKIPLYHFDLYRLTGEKELETVGLEEFCRDENAITCVEWADRAADFLPAACYRLCLEIAGDRIRRITVLSASNKVKK